MAEEPQETLKEFTDKSVEALGSKKLNDEQVAELYVLARRHPQLRQIFAREDIKRRIGEALVNKNPEGFKAVLQGSLKEASGLLPQLGAERADLPVPTAQQKEQMVKRVSDTFEFASSHKKQTTRQFAQALTENFVAQSRLQISEQQKKAEVDRIEKELFSVEWYKDSQKAATIAFRDSPYNVPAHQDAISRAIESSASVAQTLSKQELRVQEVLIAASPVAIEVENPEVTNPRVFLNIASEEAARSSDSAGAIVARSAALDRAASTFAAQQTDLPQNPLSMLASGPLQKAVAGVVDSLPKNLQDNIIEVAVTRSWEKTSQKLIDGLAGNAANSNFIRQIREGSKEMPSSASAINSISSGLGKAAAEVTAAVFREPMDEATVAYFEAVRNGVITGTRPVSWQHMYWSSAAFHDSGVGIIGAGGHMAVNFATSQIKQGVIKSILTKIGVGAGAEAAAGAVGVATGPPGWVALALGFAGGLVGKVIGFLQGGWIAGLIGAEGGEVPGDKTLFVIGGIVVLIFLLPIFPLLNFPSFGQQLIDTSLATNIVGGVGTGGPAINCEDPANKDNPDCKLTQCVGNCAWPLETASHACISEGPLVGTHSLNRLSAVDFLTSGNQGALWGAPVHTPYSGTITTANFSYPDNSGYGGNQDGGTYGNNVRIQTDKGGTLLFAHLRQIQPAGVMAGARIEANTVIGFVDHTGYSLGVHLHYEAKGADINSFLPFPVPPCSNWPIQGVPSCVSALRSRGHSNCL